jgi:hypothetical protein
MITPFFVELRWIKGILKRFTSGWGSYFRFQMADLPSFLIVDEQYLEIELKNPIKI